MTEKRTHAVTIRITGTTLARLSAEARETDMKLSQLVADIVETGEDIQTELLSLRQQVRDLEGELKYARKQPPSLNDEGAEAIIGISDALNEMRQVQNEMQEQLRELYDNQPQDLKDRIEELEQELDEIREEQMYANDEDEEEVDEDNEENEEDDKQETIEAYKSIVSNLRQDILALEKRKETDCAKFQKLGEEAMAQIAMHQFGQVVSLVAQDYTWKESIKKKMWATFRGLPKPNEAWDLVKNPYAKIKNVSSSNEKSTK